LAYLQKLTGNKVLVNKRRVFECAYTNYIRRLLPTPHNAKYRITFIKFPRLTILLIWGYWIQLALKMAVIQASILRHKSDTAVLFLSYDEQPNSCVGRLVVEVS